MTKISNIQALNEARAAYAPDVALRIGQAETNGKIRKNILICGGTGCTSSGSMALREAFEKELAAAGIADEIKLVTTGCFGLCALGPIVIVYPDGTFYSMVKPEDIAEIVDSHLVNGKVVERLEYHELSGDHHVVSSLSEMTFYKKQRRVALHNCGVIDPENINE